MLSRDPFIRPFSSLWFNQGDSAMITHCIISDMANFHALPVQFV